MKKIIIIIGLFLVVLNLSEQHYGRWGNFEEFRTKKVAFMTDKLQLTPLEAQNFWPYYNELDEKRFELHKQKMELEKQIWENYDKYTNKEFERFNSQLMELQEKGHKLMTEYHKKFLEVLPVKKVVVLDYIENEFRSQMIREFRQRKGPNKE